MEKSWLFACHMDELPEPGSFYLWERIGSPIFIVRGRDDKLRGFYNTCRHRGVPVVREQTGRRNLFVCTYHGWSYDDKGHLINMRDPRDFPDFDKSRHSLVEVAVEVFGKMVFINLDKDAKPLMDYLHPVPTDMAQFQSENMRLVRKTTLDIKCNVKILLDAFQETYHLKSIHQKPSIDFWIIWAHILSYGQMVIHEWLRRIGILTGLTRALRAYLKSRLLAKLGV